MEILAPVNIDTLDAALAAGANAVYFGLKRLNARRGAKNFSQNQLPEVVAKIHAAGAKAHLTVNIDLDTREIGLGARMLQFAEDSGVDAVIVRDPALLSLRSFFPKLEFHLSTQAGISSSAGVAAAKAIGCDRAVLARELTREEIVAAAAVDGIDTEVFIQGAMCFSCSGRCLLSSWIGGRSGNRGACASPCRIPWKANGADVTASPMSMHDLCLVEHLPELAAAGVASLKIEGRLKAPQWVKQAITLYRHATAPDADLAALRQEATDLGNYTGRLLTDAYYAHHFANLTDADAGRSRSAAGPARTQITPVEPPPHLSIEVTKDDRCAILCRCSYADSATDFRIPPQRIANPRRALTLKEVLQEAVVELPRNLSPETICDEAVLGTLLPRRCVDQLATALKDFARAIMKDDDDGTIRVSIRPDLAAALKLPPAPPERKHDLTRHHLGDPTDRARFDYAQLPLLLAHLTTLCPGNTRIILQLHGKLTASALQNQLSKLPDSYRRNLILALPAVAYEEELPNLDAICQLAKSNGYLLEVNSWDTLHLAKAHQAPFETGPGLAILNPLAALFLQQLGAQACAVSTEIDQEKLEDLCAATAVPLVLTVFGRPALMTTRAQLPPDFASGKPFADSRGTALAAYSEGVRTTLRPVTPFDWRRLSNPTVAVFSLVSDFSGSPSPIEDLKLPPKNITPFRFNYDRELR